MGSKLSCLAALQVVKKKHRTRMLEFFIDVARECFNIGNFNSMMAIICECGPRGPPPVVRGLPPLPSPCLSPPAAGMNLSPVARLKKTWSKVKTAKFDVLEVGISLRRGLPSCFGPCEDALPRVPSGIGSVSRPGCAAPGRQAAHTSSASGLQSEPALPKAEFWGEISRGSARQADSPRLGKADQAETGLFPEVLGRLGGPGAGQ